MKPTLEQLKKLAELKNIVINHPQFEHAYNIMTDAYFMKEKLDIQQNIICVGQSGTGKSTLKKIVKEAYPQVQTNEKLIIPLLIVDTPSVPTVKNIAEEVLIQLGDPRFNRGSAIEKTNRILNYIKTCEVKMVIFDELQHFIDQGKRRTPYEVSDWLKTLIDKAEVSTVLMGLERSEDLLRVNEQLRRRFSKRVDIFPFSVTEKESRNSFIATIKILDEKVNLPKRIDLTNKEIIASFYFATNGIMDYLVKLFMGAYQQSIYIGEDRLTRFCFESAFTENIWIDGIGSLNPFNKSFNFENLDKPGMPFHKNNKVSATRRKV